LPNRAVKFFSAVELIALLADPNWLDKETKTNSGGARMPGALAEC